MSVDKTETSVGFFPGHNKGTHCGGSIRILGNVSDEDLGTVLKHIDDLISPNTRSSSPCIIR